MAKVYISNDSSSCAAGAERVAVALKKECAKKKLKLDLVRTGSRGAYFLEPMIEVETPAGRVAYIYVKPEQVGKLVQKGMLEGKPVKPNFAGPVDEIPFLKKQTRITFNRCGVIDPLSIEAYQAAGGYSALRKAMKGMTPQQIIDEMKASNLRGRGGAAFPTGTKWQTTKDYASDIKYIVANCDEGDPGTYADRMLAEGAPLQLLEGMTLAARAVGATKGYIYIRSEYPAAIRKLKQAIANATEAGFLGKNILRTDLSFEVEVYVGAGAYVCGEETALLESLEGRRGMVRFKPPYPATHGLFQKPTVVNNVMTFATVPTIVDKGGAWYAAMGTVTSKGTMALQLAGVLETPGLVEVPFGITLRDVIHNFGGGMPKGSRFKAVQVGGPLGSVFPDSLLDTPVDFDALVKAGGMLGHGGIVVFDQKADMLDAARHYMEFCAHESCGKCTPCRVGSKRAEEILHNILEGRGTAEDLELIKDLSETMKATSLCALGGMAPMPVLTALQYFPKEFVTRSVASGRRRD